MRVSFRQTGGFAGLAKAVEIDTETLDPGERERVESLVERSGVFDLPEPPGIGSPDRESYAIRVESGARSRTLHVSAGALPEELKPLVRFLQGRATYEKRGGGA